MIARNAIYNVLVNKYPGISFRYHRLHDGLTGMPKVLSWSYLLWLNFAYYILQFRFLGKIPQAKMYEEKSLNCRKSESRAYLQSQPELSIDTFVEQLSRYDVISFDVFDTLIFRPFSEPADLFYFLGVELGLMNFKRIRAEQEALARGECYRDRGNYEVTFSDIWRHIEQDTGISAQRGMAAEQRLEMEFCYANPFMLEVFRQLQSQGKKIIVISDMYLPEEFLRNLLEKNGYIGISRLYVSCEYGKSKNNGKLYELVRENFSRNAKIIHVGDNEYSDVKMAGQCGFDTKYYPNVNKNASLFRPYDMSPMVGGAYRGIIDNHIYCGLQSFSMEYEYGFIYGGLFVLGYCTFIHDYCKKNSVDKILFLSRDGDILKQAYDYLYPEENTQYVYWSRKAASKLEVGYDKLDYFRRFIFHKVNQGYCIREVLNSMELDFLADSMEDSMEHSMKGRPWNKADRKLKSNDELTEENALLLKQFIEENWTKVLDTYREQNEAAKEYYRKVLSGINKAAAVDIGWAGSGAMVLRHLISEEWGLNCELVGIIAGTNTIYNEDPEASESFLQSGQLTAYLYSQSHNRDILKKHDLNKDYNVFWELLLSSPTPQFKGFYRKNENLSNGFGMPGNSYCADIEPAFGKYDANQEGIREIQKGIMEFVAEYRERFKDFPYMFHISGRDAYAPMLVAASYGEKYLKAIKQKFALEINVE